VRTVTVAAGRLEGWLAGFADRHGAPTVSCGEGVVELVGVDGARARIEVPFPPLRGELVAHVLRLKEDATAAVEVGDASRLGRQRLHARLRRTALVPHIIVKRPGSNNRRSSKPTHDTSSALSCEGDNCDERRVRVLVTGRVGGP
jgi:hypothetical protein